MPTVNLSVEITNTEWKTLICRYSEWRKLPGNGYRSFASFVETLALVAIQEVARPGEESSQ